MTQPTGKRSVKYVGPGHTQVKYETRILDIKFKETEKEFKAKMNRLKKKSKKTTTKKTVKKPVTKTRKIVVRKPTKKTAKKESCRKSTDIFVEYDEYGNMIYRNKCGQDVTDRVKRYEDDWRKEQTSSGLKKDQYTIEEMRAYLMDDHWEEVAHHTRWKWDPKSTVREFNKYLQRNKHLMY